AAWRFEWKALPEACLMTGAILAQMKGILAGLEVHAGRMRKNLDALGGFLLSERVMFALADKLGKQSAHEAVYRAAMQGVEQGTTFEAALMANAEVKGALGKKELDALLGPSGCGKSTLLRIMSGFIRQTQGRVLFDDAPVDHLPANRRGVGIVFQNYALFPHMNVRQNIAYGLQAHHWPREKIAPRV